MRPRSHRLLDWILLRRMTFWVFPSLAVVAALLLAPLIRRLDAATKWECLGFSREGASAVLAALSASMFTFIVFVISTLLLVVQLASAQLTPRIIALAFQTTHIRRAISVFAFSFAYTVAVSGRITDPVPQLPVAVAVSSFLVSIATFFYFANRVSVDLRPVSVLTKVGRDGIRVIEAVHPARWEPDTIEQPLRRAPPSEVTKIVTHKGDSGTLQVFSPKRIFDSAVRSGVTIEMVPQVGDFVAKGDPIFRISSGKAEIESDGLRAHVRIGPERTLEQDPRFAFRIIVDIANKALSAAINDPTTAVLAIDQIHRLLLFVGRRRLDEGEVRDSAGNLRLVYGTPDWADYVALGVSEIRHFGAGSIQVSRRLFAMLTHLVQVLPERRAAPLRRELSLLHASVMRAFPDAEDRALAEVPDNQGMGGAEPVGKPSVLEAEDHPAE